MTWDFETDADYRKQLEWADRFVREEVEAWLIEQRRRSW